MTEYELIFKHGVSANTIHRMKREKPSLQRHSMCSATSSIVLFLTLSNMIRQIETTGANAPVDIFIKSFKTISQFVSLPSFPAFLTLHVKFCVLFPETVILISCYNNVVKHMNPHNFTGSHQPLCHINVLR